MARACEKCGKGSQMQVTRKLLRGNYNPTDKSRKYPNLQWLRKEDGTRTRVCTQCLRTLAKTPKVAK
ncbi:MAG: hypothetical protein WD850_03370 [Candidatus Spechtbacterales bacterium]